MKRLIIEIPESGDQTTLFDVVDEAGRRCAGLCFGEMLEQITMHAIGAVPQSRIGVGYPMLTSDEWEEREASCAARKFSIVDGGRAE